MTLLGCARQLTGLVTISRQQAGDRDVFAQRLPVQAPAADPARFPLLAGATQKAREPSERNTQRSTIGKLDPHAVLVEPMLTALTKDFVPCFFDALTVSLDQGQQLAQRAGAEGVVIGKMYLGSKPEFGLPLSLLDRDVRRFTRLTLVGLEEKSKAAGWEGGWHRV